MKKKFNISKKEWQKPQVKNELTIQDTLSKAGLGNDAMGTKS